MTGSRLPGQLGVEHVAFTVPALDKAVSFFVDVLGAEELWRASRRGEGSDMRERFDVGEDASFEMAMLRIAPVWVELIEWSGAGRDSRLPRPSDAGGHHVCIAVDDVDAAVAHLRRIAGVRIIGDVTTVASGRPSAGSRWIYVQAPWGLRLELMERHDIGPPD